MASTLVVFYFGSTIPSRMGASIYSQTILKLAQYTLVCVPLFLSLRAIGVFFMFTGSYQGKTALLRLMYASACFSLLLVIWMVSEPFLPGFLKSIEVYIASIILFFVLCISFMHSLPGRLLVFEAFFVLLCLTVFTQLIISYSGNNFVLRAGIFSATVAISYIIIALFRRQLYDHQKVADEHRLLRQLYDKQIEFVSVVAHQLRTPLTIVSGYVELIQDGAYGTPSLPLQEVLGNIDQSTSRLIRLTRRFLDVAKVQQGAPIEKTTVSLEEVLNRALAHVDHLGQVHIDAPELSIHADARAVEHIISNLIENALKYSFEKDVYVSAVQTDTGVEVHVQDRGAGFSQEESSLLFKRFSRLPRTMNVCEEKSVGLGLYIAKEFVEAHAGRIWATSPGVGMGATFSFWIPAAS
jgi:signal transduction histidine kinase